MGPWEVILLTLGGNAALIAGIAWLARSIIQNWLAKDVEAFKAALVQQAAKENERLRHDLHTQAIEHQVSFSKLHERRAEVVAEAYAKLVEAYWALQSFASVVEWSEEPSKLDKYKEAMNKSTDYFRYIDKNRIFLPAPLCGQLDTFMQDMRSEAVGFGVWVQTEAQQQGRFVKEKFDAWQRAWTYFENEAPQARALLEDELRAILSPPPPR
jgi:hypothetical protein